MDELNEIQNSLAGKRKELATLESKLLNSKVALGNLDPKSQSYREKAKDLNDLIKESELKKSSLNDALSLEKNKFAKLDPTVAINQLSDSFPILLFPLRLETRFKKIDGKDWLWVRVYPDDCNINKKEELLSETELKNAKQFWIEIWKSGGVELEEKGAWRTLVNSHGSGRASFILNEYKPLNAKPSKTDASIKILVILSNVVLNANDLALATEYWATVWLANGDAAAEAEALHILDPLAAVTADQISKMVPENISETPPDDVQIAKVKLAFLQLPPDPDVVSQTTWTKAPKAVSLPDRFVAITTKNGVPKTTPFKNSVREYLPVGPDPQKEQNEGQILKSNGKLDLNEDLQWMAEFDKAVDAGMAVEIELNADEGDKGLDQLLVVGIRFSSNPEESKEELEEIFSQHFVNKDGFGLLRQGTPTNNTEDEASGYSWLEESDESFERIFKNTGTLDANSDGQKLQNALGVDVPAMGKMANANMKDQVEAIAMNEALFGATIGYFMDEMMDTVFSESDISNMRSFFTKYVKGRGPLPAVRIGRQPYGILPVTAYSQIDFDSFDLVKSQGAFIRDVYKWVSKLDETWDSFVKDISFIGDGKDPHQALMNVLGLHPNSVEFYQRYAQSINFFVNLIRLQGAPKGKDAKDAFEKKAAALLKFIDAAPPQNPPILEKIFHNHANALLGHVIDDSPLSETNKIRSYTTDSKNYIEWLISADGEMIRTENFGTKKPAPTALLYLFLRHSLMLAQSEAGILFMINKDLANRRAFRETPFINIDPENPGRSKFQHLYSSIPEITGNDSVKLLDYIYQPAVLQLRPEARPLKSTLNALEVLKSLPTARLERLFVEHLDCCNYRIDAWKTGIAEFQLDYQRHINSQDGKPSKGIYLGAYGVLIDIKPKSQAKELTARELNGHQQDIGEKVFYDEGNLGFIQAPSINQATTAAILRNAYETNKDDNSQNAFAVNLTSDRVRLAQFFLEGVRNGQSLRALLGYQFERGLHARSGAGMEADKYIYPLRKAFPLVADNLNDTVSADNDPIEAVAANNVIDGLKLIQHVQKASAQNKKYPFGLPASLNLPAADDATKALIAEEVDRIADISDAIGDLTISEQVYQVVQGNFERAAANAEAYSKGSHPPEIEVTETPRSGLTLTHRVTLQLDGEADPATTPNSVAMTPRAIAEPAINKWLSTILPDPSNVACRIKYTSPVVADKQEIVSQKDLGLQPIDLLFCLDLDSTQAMTELDDRIAHYVRYNFSNHPDTTVNIIYRETINGKVTFFEIAALVRDLKKLLVGAKSLLPQLMTLKEPNDREAYITDLAFTRGRLIVTLNALTAVKTEAVTLLTNTKYSVALAEQYLTNLSVTLNSAQEKSIGKAISDGLKDYASEPTSETKKRLTTDFVNLIAFITDAATVTTMTDQYRTLLDQYAADFNNLDALLGSVSSLFLKAAKFHNTLNGIGFIRDGIDGVLQSLKGKIKKVIKRWEKKDADYTLVIGGYAAASASEKLEILQKAERIISSTSNIAPFPANYQQMVTTKKGNFDTTLGALKGLLSLNYAHITTFIATVEALLPEYKKYDILPFDTETERWDLRAERKMLVNLKEVALLSVVKMKDELLRRTTEASASIDTADASSDSRIKIEEFKKATMLLLGDNGLILPRFIMSNTQGTRFENAVNKSPQLFTKLTAWEPERLLPVDDWLHGVARVREKIHVWENVCSLGWAFKHSNDLSLTPMQFPVLDNDRWLALRFRENDADKFVVDNDTLLYTTHFATPFNKTSRQCGVVLDEWTEVIPSKKATTGIAFHYDQPSSEPPQTMLLVVPPAFKKNWSWNFVIEAIEETLHMARKRAVEPSHIEETDFAQLLPATIMGTTAQPVTIAANLSVNNSHIAKYNTSAPL